MSRTKEQRAAYGRRQSLKRFGIDEDEYERVLKTQNGVCAICEKPCATGNRLAIDHCHRSGLIRGLLCYACNTKLGWYEKYAAQINDYLLLSRTHKVAW